MVNRDRTGGRERWRRVRDIILHLNFNLARNGSDLFLLRSREGVPLFSSREGQFRRVVRGDLGSGERGELNPIVVRLISGRRR